MKTTLNEMINELCYARVYLERAENMIAGLVEDYFNERVNNPDTPSGRENIVFFFNEARIHCGIVQGCLIDLRGALNDMSAVALAAKMEEPGQEQQTVDFEALREKLSAPENKEVAKLFGCIVNSLLEKI